MAKKKTKAAGTKRAIASVQNFKDTFSTIHGKKVLWELMRETGFNSTNFSQDPYVTSFNEGSRNTVLYILKRLNVDVKTIEAKIEQGEAQDHNIFGE